MPREAKRKRRQQIRKGFRTFNELLGSDEGIASNVLTDRLAQLEAAGVIDKREHAADARRYEYRLTKKGIDLAPVIVEIVLWSARYEQTDSPPRIVRAMSARRAKYLADIRKDWEASQ